MTPDATPDEPGRGPDDPDFVDPLTPDDILAKATKPDGSDSQASRLVTLANSHYRLLRGDDGRPYATERQGPAIAYGLRGRDALRKIPFAAPTPAGMPGYSRVPRRVVVRAMSSSRTPSR